MLRLGGCARQAELVPMPGVGALPAPPGRAAAEEAGIVLEAEPDAWRGIPSNLEEEVTPLLVTLTNDGDTPLRIRYNDFVLRGVGGQEYRALPPFDVRETVTLSIREARFNGFAVAPYLSPYYPGIRAYGDPSLFDDIYYSRYYPAFVRVNLPTGDMIQQALPEGVLEPGGRVAGFLYFEEVDEDARQVDLIQTLRTPDGDAFGEIVIPFQVR